MTSADYRWVWPTFLILSILFLAADSGPLYGACA
jgi:hypothetical protein